MNHTPHAAGVESPAQVSVSLPVKNSVKKPSKRKQKKPVPRSNKLMHEIVETGLLVLKKDGLERAAEFLSAAGVPLSVATRVLMQPSARRRGSASR